MRLQRGLYMIIPLEAGPERLWSENTYIIASNLIDPGAVSYWSALRYCNMTEQLLRVQFIQTTKRKKTLNIQGVEYRFIHVGEKHFFGISNKRIDNLPVRVTDREKTIIDAANRLDLCGGITQLAQALFTAQKDIDWEKLDNYLMKWGGGTVVKRIGFLVEKLSISLFDRERTLNHWQSMISKGNSLLEPGSEKKGPISSRWNLQINVPIVVDNYQLEM